MSFRSDAEILAEINNEKSPKLTPRQRQAKRRRFMKDLAMGVTFMAIVLVVILLATVLPNARDSCEATKNQKWQQEVAEYQK